MTSDIKRARAGRRRPAVRASRSAGASGRFVLRLDPAQHAALRAAAARAGVSLNRLCAERLARLADGGLAPPGAAGSVARASALFGERLLGLVVYGSWARGEAAEGSDVDVLVVVEGDVRIDRALYRRWDEAPATWDGFPVTPHFVHLPGEELPPTGLWAEVAVDGLVLVDRGLRVSRHLARVRRHLLTGRLVRRTVHGQPYWSEVS